MDVFPGIEFFEIIKKEIYFFKKFSPWSCRRKSRVFEKNYLWIFGQKKISCQNVIHVQTRVPPGVSFLEKLNRISIYIVFPIWFRDPGLCVKYSCVKILMKSSVTVPVHTRVRVGEIGGDFFFVRKIGPWHLTSPDRLFDVSHSFLGAERHWRALHRHQGPCGRNAR